MAFYGAALLFNKGVMEGGGLFNQYFLATGIVITMGRHIFFHLSALPA